MGLSGFNQQPLELPRVVLPSPLQQEAGDMKWFVGEGQRGYLGETRWISVAYLLPGVVRTSTT